MIRDYVAADAAQVLALNQACTPDVGPMDGAKLTEFADWAPYFRVVDIERQVVALLIGLDQTSPYSSPNFGWFVANLRRFAYIDRIAVDASQRGQGWGPALYKDFEAWAVGVGLPQLCAEVNVKPPNPRSVRFHEIYGFSQLEEFEPHGSAGYRVVMLAKPVELG
jgi:predicted GNAT superfamily acetyltransferase